MSTTSYVTICFQECFCPKRHGLSGFPVSENEWPYVWSIEKLMTSGCVRRMEDTRRRSTDSQTAICAYHVPLYRARKTWYTTVVHNTLDKIKIRKNEDSFENSLPHCKTLSMFVRIEIHILLV